jgi:putative membrane protein
MWLRAIWRFVVSAIVLIVTAYLVPGFRIAGANFISVFITAFVAALIIAAAGWVIESLFGEEVSPQGRGFISFIVAAVVIYATQFVLGNFQVTNIFSAAIAAFIIGVIDAFIPTKLR